MADLKNRVLNQPGMKPNIYCRYVDDIYTDANQGLRLKIKASMEENSVLKFTCEESQNNQLPFLDVLKIYDTSRFSTSVYVKPTDTGICLNGKSECPEKYKEAVVMSYVKRAWTTCSTYEFFEAEIARVKQVLVNNSYQNRLIDRTIKTFLEKAINPKQANNQSMQTTNVYYKNQMNSSYKVDEQVMKKIIRDNVKCKEENNRLQLVIYYNNLKTKNMVMRNNLSANKRDLSQCNVIYEFKCPHDECLHHPTLNNKYIGYTECTLSRRLSYHLQNGALVKHSMSKHKKKVNRDTAEQQTKIRYKENDHNRLEILEALMILYEKPEINKQDTGRKRILTLFN